jgi:uncharacterized protein YjiS (DUF1127 family)
MSTFEQTTAFRAASRQAWAVRAVNALSGFYRAWKNRRDFMRLGEMSDAELSDIGLVRSDLHVAVGLPLGSDPTLHLSAIARQRMRVTEDVARRIC